MCTLERVSFTEVKAEARVRERELLYTVEVGDRSSDVSMDMATDMAMNLTSMAADTAGPATLEAIGEKPKWKAEEEEQEPGDRLVHWLLEERNRVTC